MRSSKSFNHSYFSKQNPLTTSAPHSKYYSTSNYHQLFSHEMKKNGF